ncbi:MAG: phosphoglycerate kinase [Patescibacteria group bacterium]|nr:phosphoglycerate kinase [Patescibacteria group bacterium]
MKTLKDAQLKNKKVLLRVDFNVPMNNGVIEDDARIRASLPTIKYILQSGAKELIIISHFGRPVVRQKENMELIISGNKNLALKPITDRLAKWLKIKSDTKITKINKFILPAYKISKNIYLLENIRFDAREELNNRDFAQKLASLGDIYINDAFGVSHRAHASVSAITEFLPSYAGFLIEKEIANLSKLLEKPERPFVAIIGGAKIKTKIMALKNIIKKVDYILLGGVMANTFMKARNIDIRESVYEPDKIEIANDLFDMASKKFILPSDIIWDRRRIVDIGPQTIENYKKIIAKAKTIFFNGTMGLTSTGSKRFKKGTVAMIKALADSKATTIICGGDTISEVNQLKLGDKITFISTGGGASLEFLAGEKMPGIEAIK